jgi:Uma2 family endonuclease
MTLAVMSEAEYLAYDLASPIKNEFVNGEVIAMAGAHPAHEVTVVRLLTALDRRLRGKPCRVLSSNLRVHIDETGLYA